MKFKFIPLVISLIFPVSLFAQNSSQAAAAKDYTMAIAWQQYSGEYRALCFQAYNFARLSLDVRLKTTDPSRKNCVIVDIDETVLDNSPFQGYEVQHGISYDPKDWTRWTDLASADTIPGALGFLRYAKSENVETFYVSNRSEPEYQSTLKNLQKFGFPFADEAHLMVKTASSDKESRRQKIMEKYNVLLLCGDNLSDFSNVFYREGKNTSEQVQWAMQEFGTHFIVLPNPMYGDWEKSLYKEGKFDEAEKSRQRIQHLKTY